MDTGEEPTVGIGYDTYTDTKSGRLSVALDVTNQGTSPIDTIEIEWVYEYDTPIEATREFNATSGVEFAKIAGKKATWAGETGRRYKFGTEIGQKPGPLGVGETRVFLYPSEWITELISVVHSLSPERYHIAITMNGKEEVAMSGAIVGDFISRRFGAN